MSDVSALIDERMDRFRAELMEFLRIPSVSAQREHDQDVRRAANWVRDEILRIGLEAEVLETPGHPIVLGRWSGGGTDAPTALIYGHYDVQPPEPVSEWATPPFEPSIRDGRLYARGAADDKGQVHMHLKALEAHLAARGELPLNVILLLEGEEEVGSPSLLPFVEQERERLGCDVVLVSDTSMFAEGIPSILFSLRGLAYFEVQVRGARSDLHSGEYGGAVTNPGNALATILASLHDREGRIAIDGFYDDVLEWDERTREGIARLPRSDDEFRAGLEVDALTGEGGYGTLERLWIRPSCDVNGILCGYTGEGAKTVLPNRAMAKVSFRLVPDQAPERVETLFRKHVRRVAPPGVTVEVRSLHGARPWKAALRGPAFEAASQALEEAFGCPPVAIGSGGSIPIVVELEERLGAPALLVGFALPDCNLHAPDEWISLSNYERGIHALAILYERLAEQLS